MRAILNYAYNNTEFYHRRFRDAGIKPSEIRNVNDLKKLSRTTRIDLQRNLPFLVSKRVNVDKCQKYRSSGSTGIPVTVLGSGKTESYRAALFARPFFENGLRLRDKMVRITGSSQNGKKWYERLGLMRKICTSPNEPIDSFIHRVKKYNPDAIYGHSSYIYLLAKEIAEHREPLINPRLIFTTAELLSEKSRRLMKSVFTSEFFDFYGCVEVERIGWECKEHAGYHLDIDSQVIEFVDDLDEPVSSGESGDLVVTCLYNYTMPLIRYQVGDTGIPVVDECSCGRGLPLMKCIEGRRNDYIRLPSGRLIPPTSFLYIDDIPVAGIGQFQVIQENKNSVTVKLVAGQGFSNTTLEEVKKETEKILGYEMLVEVKLVNQIALSKSGKYTVVKSMINKDLTGGL